MFDDKILKTSDRHAVVFHNILPYFKTDPPALSSSFIQTLTELVPAPSGMTMEDQNCSGHKTVAEIAKGFPFSQRFHSHGEEPYSQLKPPQIRLRSTALQDRLYNEELFLVRLLAHKRKDRQLLREALVDRVDWLLQRIPIDLLSYQWLQNCTISAEIRAFLAENLLPILVLGLECILREADRRGLCNVGEEGVRMDVNFNPINRLAEFLMRNNPKYRSLTGNLCLTPYTRGMRQILQLLKQDLFLKSDSELARFSAAADKRKVDLEMLKEEEERKLDEKRRRLVPLFDCFRLEGKETVNAIIVQQAIRSFLLIAMNMPEELLSTERPIVHVENVDSHVEDYVLSEFLTYTMACVRPLSMEVFQALTDHMQRCGREYREHVNQRLKLDVIAEVAVSCDKYATEDMDTERLFEMFDKMAKTSEAELQRDLVDPHEWRIHEYHLRHATFHPCDKSVKILAYQPSTRFKEAKRTYEQVAAPPPANSGAVADATENQTNNSQDVIISNSTSEMP